MSVNECNKIVPKIFYNDQEQLYKDNQLLKNMNNSLKDENLS